MAVAVRTRQAPQARISVLLLILAALGTLSGAYFLKRPCLTTPWWNQNQYRLFCYNDIQALYGTRKLDQRKLPYIEEKSYEYPVVMGMQMWATSLLAKDHVRYFLVNVPLLAAAAILTVVALIATIGPSSSVLWFAAGTPLFLYAFLNWDLTAVAALAGAMWAWSRKRDGLCGAFLGFGAAAKLFPGYVLPALMIGRILEGKKQWTRALPLFAGAAGAWLLLNVPVLIADWQADGSPDGWLGVFAFHARRLPDFGTLWFWLAENIAGDKRVEFWHWAPVVAPLGLALFLLGSAGLSQKSWLRFQKSWTALFKTQTEALATALVLALTGLGFWILMSLEVVRTGPATIPYKELIDRLSFVLFAGGAVGLWIFQWIKRRDPWAIGAATVILFLLVSKVHSPQYALWVLPFIVLLETPAWMIVAYFIADVMLFVSGFAWFTYSPQLQSHPWQTVFTAAVYLRHAALFVLFCWYVLRGESRSSNPVKRVR